MTATELGCKLKEMYETPSVNKTTMIHLFAIIYADEIQSRKIIPGEIIKAAGMPVSYVTEIYKGMRLAKYVELKSIHANRF